MRHQHVAAGPQRHRHAGLLKAGYKPADIGKFWCGNALQVLREAQALAEPGAVAAIHVTR